MSNPFVLKGRIYQVLFERGPMLYEDILKFIPDASIKKLRDCIVMDRFNNKDNGKKVFRVVKYLPTRGTGGSQRPVIGLGSEPDVAPPVIKNAANDAKRRYDLKHGKIAKATRSEMVFASMFGGVPEAAPTSKNKSKGRVFRTSNQDPVEHAKTKQHLESDSSLSRNKASPAVADRHPKAATRQESSGN